MIFSDEVIVDVSCGARHTAFVTADGHVYVCGDSTYGQCALTSIDQTTHPALITFEPSSEPSASCLESAGEEGMIVDYFWEIYFKIALHIQGLVRMKLR